MNRMGFNGLVLMGAAMIAYLFSQLVGTAYASRHERNAVAIAVSSGPELTLRERTQLSSALARPSSGPRTLYCRSVMSVGAVSVGYDCQQS